MISRSVMARAAALGIAAALFLGVAVQAAEIRVVSSGGFAAALRTLAPAFEQATGDTLVIGFGPSMGQTVDAVPARLARNEPVDVLIMVGYALGQLIDQGKVATSSRVDLAQSGIGVVVQAGAPRPDVGTVDALRRTLLAAKSIAYSDSASGIYIQNQMLRRMGIADQVAGKVRMIPAEPVGAVVARGDAEIGFQQISELRPIRGIELVGPLPPEVQQVTVFSAGILANSCEPEAAAALIRFLASPAIADSGMEPLGRAARQ